MNPKEFFIEHNEKNIRMLYKAFLILIEDLHKDHQINFQKLRLSFPSEFSGIIDQADYFDEKKLKYLRKKILDMGNEVIRMNDSELANFTISFKF